MSSGDHIEVEVVLEVGKDCPSNYWGGVAASGKSPGWGFRVCMFQ